VQPEGVAVALNATPIPTVPVEGAEAVQLSVQPGGETTMVTPAVAEVEMASVTVSLAW
jgi:hypothetical protein